jgi:ABC-2 type transport system ATP-binding protein
MAELEVISVEGLSRSYGELKALKAVSFAVERGQVFGLLGPNGAGKTTLMRLLMGQLVPSAGSARIGGQDCYEDRVVLKRHVGYLPDTPFFYDFLTGWDHIRFVSDMHGLPATESTARAEQLLASLELSEAASDFPNSYSLGMKKKLSLVLALLHQPELLILDEPVSGLDPRTSRHIQHLVRDYAQAGRAVVLSTHRLDLVESMCDRLAILHHGQLVASGSPAELRAQGARAGGDSASLEEAFLCITATEVSETVAS